MQLVTYDDGRCVLAMLSWVNSSAESRGGPVVSCGCARLSEGVPGVVGSSGAAQKLVWRTGAEVRIFGCSLNFWALSSGLWVSRCW